MTKLLALALAAAVSASGSAKPPKAPPAPPPPSTPAPAPAAAPPPAAPAREPVEKEARIVALDEKSARRVHPVRTAPSYATTLEFPEAFVGQPVCGDCITGKEAAALGGKPNNALFLMDVFMDGRYLTIKPRQLADASLPAADYVTTLTVHLEHYTLTFQIEYADLRQADARIVFTLPQRQGENAYIEGEVAKAKAKLEADFAARIDKAVIDHFLRDLSGAHHCASASAHVRSDDLVAEVQEICVFGSNVYLKFIVENRSRVACDLGDVTVRKGRNRKLLAPADAQVLLSDHLEGLGTVTGVVGLPAGEGEEAATVFEITVTERGGRARQLKTPAFEL
jgi:hypothetical protein